MIYMTGLMEEKIHVIALRIDILPLLKRQIKPGNTYYGTVFELVEIH